MEGRNSMKQASTSGPTLEAQALAEIALAFCRECLGWKNARGVNDCGYPYISESVSKELADTKILPFERQFHYTQPDRVTEAVQAWLESTRSTRDHHTTAAARSMHDAGAKYLAGSLDQADVCRDLLAACVQAYRRRKP
jgi:hypothetical protein